MTLSSTIEQTTTHELFHDPIIKRSSRSEDAFRRMLLIERKRTERSGCSFLFMLIDGANYQAKETKEKGIHSMIANARRVREVTSDMAKPSPLRTASPNISRATESGKW